MTRRKDQHTGNLFAQPAPPPAPPRPERVLLPAEELRDAGRDRVHDNNLTFADQVIRILPRLSLPATFIGEDVRVAATAALDEEPRHPNAWGAIITRALREGLIEEVPEAGLRAMTTRRSHARRSPVYRLITEGARP